MNGIFIFKLEPKSCIFQTGVLLVSTNENTRKTNPNNIKPNAEEDVTSLVVCPSQ